MFPVFFPCLSCYLFIPSLKNPKPPSPCHDHPAQLGRSSCHHQWTHPPAPRGVPHPPGRSPWSAGHGPRPPRSATCWSFDSTPVQWPKKQVQAPSSKSKKQKHILIIQKIKSVYVSLIQMYIWLLLITFNSLLFFGTFIDPTKTLAIFFTAHCCGQASPWHERWHCLPTLPSVPRGAPAACWRTRSPSGLRSSCLVDRSPAKVKKQKKTPGMMRFQLWFVRHSHLWWFINMFYLKIRNQDL